MRGTIFFYSGTFDMLIRAVGTSYPCLGNPDEKFLSLLNARKGVFKDHTGK